MVDTFALTGHYDVASQFGEGIEVLYSYTEKDPLLESVTISYDYTDGIEGEPRVIGCVEGYTQKIVNNLPLWMWMRQSRESEGYRFVNSWAQNMEDSLRLFNDYRKEQFLDTANVYDDIHTGISELTFSEEKIYSPVFRNSLFNSSFSMVGAARTQRPEGWRVERTGLDALKFDAQRSLFGNHALHLDGSVGSVEIKQRKEAKVSSGFITASCYSQSANVDFTLDDVYEPQDAGIILVIHYADGTAKSFGAGFPKTTGGKWARSSLSVTVEAETHAFEFMIVNRSGASIYVDLPQVESGKKPSQWTPSALDSPIYGKQFGRNVTSVQAILDTSDGGDSIKVEVHPTATPEEFRDMPVPTRIEAISPKEEPVPQLNLAYGRRVSYYNDITPTMWPAKDGKIVEQSLTSADKYTAVTPMDLFLNQDGFLRLNREALDDGLVDVKATTVVGNILYVVTEETYAGKTALYLKFVRPDKIDLDDQHLESLGDLELPLELGEDFGIGAPVEDVVRVGICSALPNCIYIDTNLDRRFYFRLLYDYYYADLNKRKLFCRERYLSGNSRLQVV